MKVELIKPRKTVAEQVAEELGFEIVYYDEGRDHRVVTKQVGLIPDNRKATETELALWRSLLEARKNADMPLKGMVAFKVTAWVNPYVSDNEVFLDEEFYETKQDAHEDANVGNLEPIQVEFFGIVKV